MLVKKITSGKWRENCYVIKGDGLRVIIIDPGEECDEILRVLKLNNYQVSYIVCTHAHYDHISSVHEIKEEYSANFLLNSLDSELLSKANFYRYIFGGEKKITIPKIDIDLLAITSFKFDSLDLSVIFMPGHTAGSTGILINGCLFSGDTIFSGGLGRVDLPGGNKEQLMKSVRDLSLLPMDTVIYPGHGQSMILSEFIKNNSELFGKAQ